MRSAEWSRRTSHDVDQNDMKSSRRRLAALALTLMAAGGLGASLGAHAWHSNAPRAGTSAGGSWYSVADGMDTTT